VLQGLPEELPGGLPKAISGEMFEDTPEELSSWHIPLSPVIYFRYRKGSGREKEKSLSCLNRGPWKMMGQKRENREKQAQTGEKPFLSAWWF
jgi:hypothetical protein